MRYYAFLVLLATSSVAHAEQFILTGEVATLNYGDCLDVGDPFTLSMDVPLNDQLRTRGAFDIELTAGDTVYPGQAQFTPHTMLPPQHDARTELWISLNDGGNAYAGKNIRGGWFEVGRCRAYWTADWNVEPPIKGDANLDGVFDSTDLVEVFNAGKYENRTLASWHDGDWNDDRRFDSADLADAFRDGAYQGSANSPPLAVPEPSSLALLLFAVSLWCAAKR